MIEANAQLKNENMTKTYINTFGANSIGGLINCLMRFLALCSSNLGFNFAEQRKCTLNNFLLKFI